MKHECPGARVVPWQFCTPPKTPPPPPEPFMSCGAPLTFVTVMVCSSVVEPTGTYPKSRALGLIRKRLVAVTVGAADAIVVKPPVTPATKSTDRRAQRIRCPENRRKNIYFSLSAEATNLCNRLGVTRSLSGVRVLTALESKQQPVRPAPSAGRC